jgi:hypothetical protein
MLNHLADYFISVLRCCFRRTQHGPQARGGAALGLAASIADRHSGVLGPLVYGHHMGLQQLQGLLPLGLL